MLKALLLFLFLPLTSFGQYNRSTYATPTMQQNQQSRDYFNRSMAQQQRDFRQGIQQQQQSRMDYYSASPAMSQEELRQAQAKQLQLEKDASEKLAQLAQELRRQREQHPAADAQQAALQQKQAERQLTRLAVTNYREVFLPGQVASAQQAQQLSAKGRRQLQYLNTTLWNKAWLKKQDDAQLPGYLKACGDTLNSLTAGLLGFDPLAPPALPAPFSANALTAQLATDAFDQQAATQLMQAAALTTKLFAGRALIRAVKEFSTLTAAVATPEPRSSAKQLRDDVQASQRMVQDAMSRYYYSVSNQITIDTAREGLLSATAAYLEKK